MKYLALLTLVILMVGCANENQITIENDALASVRINFRAKTYLIGSGDITKITEIPNGTYDYSTTYTVPLGLVGAASGDAAAGTLTFEEKNTKINFIYSSMITDSTYTLGCTKSSTHSISSTTAVTSP